MMYIFVNTIQFIISGLCGLLVGIGLTDYQVSKGLAGLIIVQDAPVIFTTRSVGHLLVKPYVKGYIYAPIGVPLERYLWLDWSGQGK